MQLAPPTRHLRWPCLLLLFVFAAPAARACTIPVFRYALERWELSPYEVAVFHRGPVPAKTQAALDRLPTRANFRVTMVDLDAKLNSQMQQLWQRHGQAAALPWMIVRRPDAGAKAAPVWTGPCDAEHLRQLADSPARQKAVAALSEGKTVFVLLLSGDRAADESAERLVRGQLAKLERLVTLPAQSGDGPHMKLALPLTVGFIVLPLQRDVPEEELFIRILLGAEDGLAKVRGPMAFPIFGRGRLLGCLYGAELDADNLFEVVNFLCGKCSCEVKELNPGMDLPIAADWPTIFERIGPAPDGGPETPPGATRIAARVKPATDARLAGSSKPARAEPEEVRVAVSAYPPTVDQVEPPAAPPYRRWLWIAAGAAAMLVMLTGAWAWAQWRYGRCRDTAV